VPLTGAHTHNSPQILQRLGISLLVTTYNDFQLLSSSFVLP
jgi:hypothetical protein